MSDVDRILDEYVADHGAGKPAAPLEYLARVTKAERPELEALIDAYLERASPQPWDSAAFQGSSAERLVKRLDPMLEGQSAWTYVLPDLRGRAKLLRKDLVARLAEALGVRDREERVGEYYHQMEQGLLRPEGVNQRVLEELGKIVGASADALRRAGQGLGELPGRPDAEAAAFARVASAPLAAPPTSPGVPPAERQHDEVDRLFLDG